jgi:hypothetical protein
MMLDADVVPCSPSSVYRVLKANHLLAGSSPVPSKKGYITPKDKLKGRDKTIHEERDRKLAEARARRRQARQTDPHVNKSGDVESRPAIDFAAIKSVVTITMVLTLLGATGQTRGQQHRGPCPLHGTAHGTSRCLSAHLDENIFHCFRCGQSGDAIDLYAKATRQPPYDAAREVCERLGIDVPLLPSVRSPKEPVPDRFEAGTMPSPHSEAVS